MRLAASASCGAESSSVPSRSTTMARALTGVEYLRMAAAGCMAVPLLVGLLFGGTLVRLAGRHSGFFSRGRGGFLPLGRGGFFAHGCCRFFGCGCGGFFTFGCGSLLGNGFALGCGSRRYDRMGLRCGLLFAHAWVDGLFPDRSEEHTSELQSPKDLVCRLLLEKK